MENDQRASAVDTQDRNPSLDFTLHRLDLLPALQRLDRLPEQAIAAAATAYGPGAAIDPFRGLHVSQDEAERLLAREPGAPTLWAESASDPS